MATIAVGKHPMKLTTPLGPDAFVLLRLQGREAVSETFRFELDVAAEREESVEFDKLLGRAVSVELAVADGKVRHFSGIVSRLAQGRQDARLAHFRLEVVPAVWLLSKRRRSRIFQHKTVPDILKEVLSGLDVQYELRGRYEPRNYCTQYRESDLDFISRLMEDEGIFYFFKHTASGHQLVIGDTPAAHPDLQPEARITYDPVEGGTRPQPRISRWEKVQELSSSKTVLWDHTFELPDKNLEAEQAVQASLQVGTVSHKLKLQPNDALEVYDYPGEYAQRFDGVDPSGGDRASDVQKILQDNKRTAQLRMQEHAATGLVIHGSSDCRHLTAGHKFTLTRHFDADGDYILTSVTHRAEQDFTSGAGTFAYENDFTCIPHALPYRPARQTVKPRVAGCQTAVVVGPSGEEIFTDKYGRVKVQFHWDREGKKDAKSSCWVRVATVWAGKQWGAIHIPRIGQEVVVDFLEGDPDRPIIVGSVYNAEQMPPYKLPANMTQSGIKTRSSKDGSPENFNEIRFEDKKDSEEIYVHAEKDLNAVVENNETRKVGFEKKDKGDQTVEVFNNRKVVVGGGKTDADEGSETKEVFNNQVVKIGTGKGQAKDGSHTIDIYKDRTATLETGNEKLQVKQGNRTVIVDTGNDTHQVKTGNRDVEVDTGNDTHKVKKGNRDVQIDMGNDTLTIKMGNQTTKLNLGKSATEAMQSIELKVGQNSIKIDQMGVTIKGMMVKIEGTIQTEVKGLMTQIKGDAMLKAQGGITMIN